MKNILLSILFVLILNSTLYASGVITQHYQESVVAECTGWNCEFSDDPNIKALYNFESGALTTDSKGSYTLTANATPAADTGDYIQGAASVDLELDDSDSFTRSGSTSDFGWATSGEVSITGWFKAETSVANSVLFGKGLLGALDNVAIRINFTYESRIGIEVDGDDNGTTEAYLQTAATTDGHWIFFAVAIDNTDDAYRIYTYDGDTSTAVETKTGTLSASIANLNVAADINIGHLDSASYFDGKLDEITVWDKELTQTEIEAIRDGTYGK